MNVTPYSITITEDAEGIRIDKYIASAFPMLSRTYIQKLIQEGHILVNNLSIKSRYSLSINDIVLITIPEPEALDLQAQDIPLNVTYEDHDIIVINKPKGMVVHPAPGHYTDTLVNALLFHCKNELSGVNGVLRPGIVHRIDKDTTGLLLVCKNDISHRFIAEQLSTHSLSRTYQAITSGLFNEPSGTIDRPIGRDLKDRKKMSIQPNGKNAITHYNVLDEYSNTKGLKFSHIECKLETGRTHQIRVHMASVHHPLLGDQVYGSIKQPYNTQGQTLHAKTLGIIHPTTKKYVEFNSDLPEYFDKLLNNLNKI